ncbi:MAG: hypothetical protein CMJ84_09920 [Planctomycetes bacterium]|nr:hypothetical protein [Planctomycetota bacterium]
MPRFGPIEMPENRAGTVRFACWLLLLASCSGGGTNAPGGGDPPPGGGAGGGGPILNLSPEFVLIDHPDQIPGSDFGISTCILDFDGDGHADLAVGAEGEEQGSGAVYVFWGPHLRQDQFLRIPAPNSQPAGLFGHELCRGGNLDGVSGDELLVGAPEERAAEMNAAGAAYVISMTAAPVRIVSGTPESDAYFGTSLAVGDFEGSAVPQIAVGARGATSASGMRGGRVEFFHFGPLGLLVAGRILTNPEPTADAGNGNFGRLLAVERDGQGDPRHLIVPALANPSGGHSDAGLVYVYTLPLTGLPAFVLPSPVLHWEEGAGTRLGMSLDTASGLLLAGAPRHDLAAGGAQPLDNAGCALLYEGPAFDATSPRVLRRSDHPAEIEFPLDLNGYQVALADVLGADGVSDLVIFGLNIHSEHGMSILVYDGQAPGSPPVFIEPLPDSSGHFAEGVCHGQLAPGGPEELVVGDARYGPGEDRRGRVVIFTF